MHLGKAPHGIEGNVQIGCVSNGFRKYFRAGSKGLRKVTQRDTDSDNATGGPQLHENTLEDRGAT